MRINKISLIGVDEKTNLYDLVKLQYSTNIPLEYGFLYSSPREGEENRYPTGNFINFAKGVLSDHSDGTVSLHLCGDVAYYYLVNEYVKNYPLVHLIENIDRIQFNLHWGKLKQHPIEIIEDGIAYYQQNDQRVIFQYNDNNKEFIDLLKHRETHVDILFDNSGGLGKELNNPQKAIKGFNCGYAGGISPDNVYGILNRISQVNDEDTSIYIDMESGIRDENDWFSIEKCKQVIKEVERWITDNE